MTKGNNQAVSKLYRTCEESQTPEIAQINGKIPDWLNGKTLLTTGPAYFDFPSSGSDGQAFTMNHWLDGYAMLCKFSIGNQEVKFEKKFLQSGAYQKGVKSNKPLITEFGTAKFPDPNKGFFSRMISAVMPIELSDNNQISIYTMGKEVFCSSETSFFRQIDPENLGSSIGDKHDSNKTFGTNIACAHPLFDETGAMYNIGSTVITGTKYNIIRVPPPASNATAKDLFKKSQIICSIPSSWTGLMSYNHSFCMTKQYIVFIEQPFLMNLAKAALTYLKNPAFREWLEWRPELKNRFFVIEKATGKVVKTEFLAKTSFFFLHQINSYEENDQIVIDLLSYPNPDVLDSMYLSKLRSGDLSMGSSASTHRYVIPCNISVKDVPENVNLVDVKSDARAIRVGNSIILEPEILSQPGLEMPMINKKCCGQKHSYFYGNGAGSGTAFSNSLCKVDVKRKETVFWRENEFANPGEPQFISFEGGGEEDDGIILSAVTDSRPDASDFLVVLDAKSFQELGRAKFPKSHIPLSLHGVVI